MTKEQWKEELDGICCHLVREDRERALITMKDIPDIAYTRLIGRAMVENLTRQHDGNWFIVLKCYYNLESGVIEYEGLVYKGYISSVNLEIEKELQRALDEEVKKFYKNYRKCYENYKRCL